MIVVHSITRSICCWVRLICCWCVPTVERDEPAFWSANSHTKRKHWQQYTPEQYEWVRICKMSIMNGSYARKVFVMSYAYVFVVLLSFVMFTLSVLMNPCLLYTRFIQDSSHSTIGIIWALVCQKHVARAGLLHPTYTVGYNFLSVLYMLNFEVYWVYSESHQITWHETTFSLIWLGKIILKIIIFFPSSDDIFFNVMHIYIDTRPSFQGSVLWVIYAFTRGTIQQTPFVWRHFNPAYKVWYNLLCVYVYIQITKSFNRDLIEM